MHGGHFASACTATFDKYGDPIVSSSVCATPEEACTKCLNVGHCADKCIAKCDKFGNPIALDQQQYTSMGSAVAAPAEFPPIINRKRSLDPAPVLSLTSGSKSSKNSSSTAVKINKKKSSPAGAGACRRCGRDSHWEVDCYATTDIDGQPIGLGCGRCGRDHDEDDCYASTDIDGRRIVEKKRPTKTKSPVAAPAKATKTVTVKPATKKPKTTTTDWSCCERCGRESHSASSCYAGTHANGKKLPKASKF
jgi:hypothetical protein